MPAAEIGFGRELHRIEESPVATDHSPIDMLESPEFPFTEKRY
jgi:hypothetical protein